MKYLRALSASLVNTEQFRCKTSDLQMGLWSSVLRLSGQVLFVSFPGRVLQFVTHSSLTLAANLAVPETTAKKDLSLSAITENALVSVREI